MLDEPGPSAGNENQRVYSDTLLKQQ